MGRNTKRRNSDNKETEKRPNKTESNKRRRTSRKRETGRKRRRRRQKKASVMNNSQTKPRGHMGSPAYHHSELSITRPSVRHGLDRQGHDRPQNNLAQERSNKQ